MPVVITGLKELSTALAELPARTAKRYLTNAAKPAAEVVIAAMESTAPVGDGKPHKRHGVYVVGHLRDLLDYKTRFSGSGTDQATLTVKIGPAGAWWGIFQEFGTRFQPAKHWMARAFDSCKDKVLSVFATELLARLSDMENKQ